jgi:hypothetical protein
VDDLRTLKELSKECPKARSFSIGEAQVQMSWLSKQILLLHRMSMIAFVDFLLVISVLGQTAPASPDHPWHGSAEFSMKEDSGGAGDWRFATATALHSVPPFCTC